MAMLLLALLLAMCASAQLLHQQQQEQSVDHHQQHQQHQQSRSPWLLHDPGFAVDVRVSPFGDELWTDAHIQAQDASQILRIPSSLLNITVLLPALRNLSDVRVTISLFKKAGEMHEQEEKQEEQEFQVVADTQVQYARSYRMTVSYIGDQVVLRVYVEGAVGRLADSAAPGVTMRAFFVRTIDLTPSEAQYHLCHSDGSETNDDTESTASPPERESEDSSEPLHHAVPPVNMPPQLCQQYTMGGRVPVRKWYFDDQSDAEQSYAPRSFAFIEEMIGRAKRRERYYYGVTDDFLFAAMDKHGVEGKHVLIVGSTTPWYESICVAVGAASCTTIDYNALRYDHPALQTFTLAEFAAAKASGQARSHFDVIVSISSFEHDGLGRYGDPLAPDADLEAMRSLLQYAHPPGGSADGGESGNRTKLLLAVPVGPDCVVWNAQRIYGPLRLPLLVESWSLIDSFGFQKSDFVAPFSVGHQPVFVLEPHAAESRAQGAQGAQAAEHESTGRSEEL